MKHIFIVNPVAGKGKHVAKLTEDIKAACADAKADYEIYTTKCAGDGREYVHTVCQNGTAARFYACGGDGTVNEVMQGLAGNKACELAVIPCGSGNDFVRTFGDLPFNDIKAQLAGKSSDCDLIKTNLGLCVNLCSAGFDSWVGKRVAEYKNLPLVSGSMAYVISVVRQLFCRMWYTAEFKLDGGELFEAKCTLAAFGNGICYGGGFKATPYASTSDGLIEAVFVKDVSRLTFIRLVGAYKKGEHLRDAKFKDIVTYKQIKSLEMHSKSDVCVNLDGECQLVKDFTAEILPNAIKLSLPIKQG